MALLKQHSSFKKLFTGVLMMVVIRTTDRDEVYKAINSFKHVMK